MWNQVENIVLANKSATPASFTLRGGNYSIEAVATWGGGSVTLNRLAADGSTYVSTGISFTANGYQNQNLPSGTYQLAIASATAVYVDIVSTVTTL